MINEDYVSYETAQLLKEKGFDELCSKKYNGYKSIVPAGRMIELWQNSELDFEEECSAPTHQMAMKWLREKHIVISITPKSFFADGCCASWAYSIWADDNSEVDGEEEWKELYESYEQAVEAALKYSLKNLV